MEEQNTVEQLTPALESNTTEPPTPPVKRIKLTYQSLPLSDIHPDPNQPRKKRNAMADKELAESMRSGLLHPIIVRRGEDKRTFSIISGERRWGCAGKLGWATIDCLIAEHADQEIVPVLQLIENVQREDLNPTDLANHLKHLFEKLKADDDKTTLRTLASVSGKSLGWVSEKLALANLPQEVQALKESNTVKNSRVLIGLSKLSKENPFAANSIIEKIESGERITPEVVSKARGLVKKSKQEDERKTDEQKEESIEGELNKIIETLPTTENQAHSATNESVADISAPLSLPPKKSARKPKVIKIVAQLGISEDLTDEELLEILAEKLENLLNANPQ